MNTFELTFIKFKELLDYLVKHNYVKVDEKGKIIEKPCKKILSPLSFFLFDDDLKSKDLERYFHHKIYGMYNIFATMEYYLLYKNSHNGQEPFNLMEYVNDVAEVGARYGWRGNPFNILLSKKTEENVLKVKVMYCDTDAGSFSFDSPKTETFNFDSSNYEQFETNASRFSQEFKYKEFELPFSKTEMIQKIEKDIETQKKALKILKQIYK